MSIGKAIKFLIKNFKWSLFDKLAMMMIVNLYNRRTMSTHRTTVGQYKAENWQSCSIAASCEENRQVNQLLADRDGKWFFTNESLGRKNLKLLINYLWQSTFQKKSQTKVI